MEIHESTAGTWEAARDTIEFDAEGFLKHPSRWNKDLARRIAEIDGIGVLGPDHWAIVFHIRDHYLNFGSLPAFGHVCRTYHLGKDAVRQMFGSCRAAWRIAGLPDPGEEARTYMN